jgi:Uncharacterised nucleotidyltransferase
VGRERNPGLAECALGSKQGCRFGGYMKIVATLAEKAAAAGLPFLVIGGNAVIAYGFPRQTVDVDLLVRQTDRQAWEGLIVPLGYRAHHLDRVFQMYNPIPHNLPPVDLMMVNEETFGKLSGRAQETVLGGTTVRIPSLAHLIALKLHALRHGGEHRRTRDFVDVIELVQLNRVDLASPEYAEILERYATPALVVEIQSRLAGPGSSGA